MPKKQWTRRQFSQRTLLAAASTGAIPWALGCVAESDEVPPPNTPRGIILITADDLGWRDLGAYGLASVATPSLDRLADEGMAFTSAFDVVSTCSSSRASYVTGQYPHTHGVTGLVHRNPELSLPPEHPTIVRSLSEAGFATALQGKFHLSVLDEPLAFGYDEYLATDLDQVIRSSAEAVAFLHQHQEDPFYLELNYMQTHRDLGGNFPQQPGFEVADEDSAPPDWWGLPNWPEIREEVGGYLSRLRWMDSLVGEVLAALDDFGMAEDTLVVFISDNGPAFPGCKLTLYDRGTGTPLMFRWPAGIPAQTTNQLVSSVDLAPTLLALAGVAPLEGFQGRSLDPLLRDAGDWTPADFLFSEMESHTGPKPARAVRSARYKYIRNVTDTPWGSGGGNGDWRDLLAEEPDQTFDEPRPPEELFDLETDPLERNNLINDPEHAHTLESLRQQLDWFMLETNDPRREELLR